MDAENETTVTCDQTHDAPLNKYRTEVAFRDKKTAYTARGDAHHGKRDPEKRPQVL